MGSVLVALVAAFSLAIHYRHQSACYRQQWECALAELTAGPATEARVSVTTEVSRIVYVRKPVLSGEDDSALSARIITLEGQLREKESQLAALQSSAAGRSSGGSTSLLNRASFAHRGGTNEVARRDEFEKRRLERQQTIQAAFAKKAAFLLNRDTAKLSEAEKKEYEQMVGLLDESWKMAAQVQQPDLPREQRREVMHTLRDTVRVLDPLLESERARQFRDLGVTLGYSGPAVDEFANYISDIIEVTDIKGMTPDGHGRGSGEGGRSVAAQDGGGRGHE